MYRNRARAAHKLQSQAQQQQSVPQQQATIQQQPGYDNQQGGYDQQQGWVNSQDQPQAQTVPFFNPNQYQNGSFTQPPLTDTVKANGTVDADLTQNNGSNWHNINQNSAKPDQNHNHNQQYNLNHNQDQEYNQNQQQVGQNKLAVAENKAEENIAAHNLTLDPSGQWFWDYQAQQWFPYYPQQPMFESQNVIESIDNITQGIQQLTTAANTDEHYADHGPGVQTYDQGVQQYDQGVQQHEPNAVQSGENLQTQSAQHIFNVNAQPTSQAHELIENDHVFNSHPNQQIVPEERDGSQVSDTSFGHVAGRLRQDSLMSNSSAVDGKRHDFIGDVRAKQDNSVADVQALASTTAVLSSPWVVPVAATTSEPITETSPPAMGFSNVLEAVSSSNVISTLNSTAGSDFSPQAAAGSESQESCGVGGPSMVDLGDSPSFQQGGVVQPALPISSPARDSVPPVAFSPPIGSPHDNPLQSIPPPSLGPPDLVDHRPNTSQPELVSDISHSSSPGSPHHQPSRSVPPPDMFASLPSGSEQPAPPDLTSQSVMYVPHTASSPSLVSHDQHYEFYSQAYNSSHGMPDVTGGQQSTTVAHGADVDQASLTHVKAPDILRTEPVPTAVNNVPSSDRNLFMETGELMEEDAVRVSQESVQVNSPTTGASFPQLSSLGASSLPPMVGGNEHYGQPAPPLTRLVVGESHADPNQAPPNRLVEGDIAPPSLLPIMPVSREVEGESHPAPSPSQQQFVSQSHQTREPLEGQSEPIQARVVPGIQSPPPLAPPAAISSNQPPSLLAVQVSSIDPAVSQSPTEVRSEAAGSDRRDVVVMGGPPPQSRPAPMPTPGRDITGEESRDVGVAYRRDPYDSEDDRDRDSDSGERRRYGHNRNRRTVSPGARSGHHRPARILDRSYRSSTDRDDSDRIYGGRREEDRRHKRNDRDRERDRDRDRDREHRSYYDKKRRKTSKRERRGRRKEIL